ncbi:YjgN family protein [Rheinheimera oceanensis]|uniref:YjgN family protein n=1 Tax=Rheinheimera oceanensis TaxID=2817449 RepID=UPI001BFDAB0B|nr:YjgN family protein [Rheinheimera oceanensis]
MENTLDTTVSQPGQARISKVAFSGQAGEFFGIWIVNLLLSIVTLGIYSAWAKVRTNQYFYGHTRIDNQSFRYLATPVQILKGRIIAVIIFALFFIASSLSPVLAVVLALLFLPASPWLIVQSLKFNMRMTSYRNVRFAFHGDYAGAFKYFVLLPVLAVFTLYLAMPWVLKKIDGYICSNTSFGGQKMQINTDTSSYYIAVLVAMAAVMGVITVMIIVGAVLVGVMAATGAASAGVATVLVTAAVFVMYFFAFALSGAIYHSMIRNHIFERTELPGIAKFKSEMRVMPYLWLTVTNLLAIIFSLGLAYPWAKIRKAAYLASVTTIAVYPQADSLVDQVQQSSNAFGEEAAGLFDIDVSLA